MKGLKISVYEAVKSFFEGNFPGGQQLRYSAKNNGIGLPMETSKFEKFTQADYDAIYAKLVEGSIKIIGDRDDAGEPVNMEDLPLKKVVLKMF